MSVATPKHPTSFVAEAGTHFLMEIFDSVKRELERIPKAKHSGQNRVCLMNITSNAYAAKKTTK